MGTPLPPLKGGGAPKFWAHVYCGQTAGWIKMALGLEVGLSPGDFVLDGDPAPPLSRKGAEPPPQFSTNFIVAKPLDASRCMLGMEVGLSPKDFVLARNRPPPQKGGGAILPKFRPMSIVAKWLDGSR